MSAFLDGIFMTDALPEYLTQGEQARLFPVLATTSKEGRTTSIVLACLARIDEFGASLLNSVGQTGPDFAKSACCARRPSGNAASRFRPMSIVSVLLYLGKMPALSPKRTQGARRKYGIADHRCASREFTSRGTKCEFAAVAPKSASMTWQCQKRSILVKNSGDNRRSV